VFVFTIILISTVSIGGFVFGEKKKCGDSVLQSFKSYFCAHHIYMGGSVNGQKLLSVGVEY